MDPGGVGALIGIGAMLCIFLSMKLREMYLKRKKKNLSAKPVSKTPLLSDPAKFLKVKHAKMNKILPPLSSTRRSISLANLGGSGSRNLKI